MTLPWSLLATCAVGALLMFSRLLFGAQGSMGNGDHLVGALLITIAGIATAEVARTLRFLNVLLGLLADRCALAALGRHPRSGVVCDFAGFLVLALSLPRGRRSQEHYGSWTFVTWGAPDDLLH